MDPGGVILPHSPVPVDLSDSVNDHVRLNVAREVLLYFRGHHLTSYFNTLYGRMRYYFTGDPFSEKVLSAL